MVIAGVVKYKWVILVCFLIIIGLAVWVSATSGHQISSFILKFFNDWSTALAAGATLLVAIIAFLSFSEGRRHRNEQMKDEIDDWARKLTGGVVIKSQESIDQDILAKRDFTALDKDKTLEMLGTAWKTSSRMVNLAGRIDVELKNKVDEAQSIITSLTTSVRQGESLGDIVNIYHRLLDVALNIISYKL